MEEDGLLVSSESVTVYRVKRDGNWRSVVPNLLVQGTMALLIPLPNLPNAKPAPQHIQAT